MEAYREGVADTEARYKELVEAVEQLLIGLRKYGTMYREVEHDLEAALVKLKAILGPATSEGATETPPA